MSKIRKTLNQLKHELESTNDNALYSKENIFNVVNLLLSELGDKETNKWISVAERFPENTGDYIVSTKNGEVMEATYKKKFNKFYLTDTSGDILVESVTAWMLFPKSYEVENNG